MTKEEKIKEAYIEVFGEKRIRSIMNYVYKENGFIEGFVLLDLKLDIKNEKLERKFNGVVYSYRPKSLQGIENNNGWIDGIPKEKGWYFIEYINKFIEPKEFLDNAEDFIWWNLNVIKHQKIFFPKQSLF